MLEYLKDKRILFFGLDFYDYENAIKQVLLHNGAIVDYINSLKINFFQKTLCTLGRKQRIAENFQRKNIWKSLKKFEDRKYDYVFVIKGDVFSKEFAEHLKRLYPDTLFILYEWDSLTRYPNIVDLFPFFDKVMSFDYADCERYSIQYRPLFCKRFSDTTEKDIDVLFVGTAHTDRVETLQNLYLQYLKVGKKCIIKIFLPKLTVVKLFLLRKLKIEFFRNCVTTKIIPNDAYFLLLQRAKNIIDIHHPNQTGLTMRTIEALANGTCIYTTNENIKREGVPKSCYEIIDRNALEIGLFKDLHFKKFDREKYTIISFINDLFSVKRR